MDEREVERLVRLVPAWHRADLTVHPIHGGITNRNYRVSTADGEYVVRVPGERTELLGIDRRNEAEAARRAAEAGIGPQVLGELPGVGTLIVEFLEGRHLGVDELTEHLADVVDVIHDLHASGPLSASFPIHRVVEWHARDATAHGITPPGAYERLHRLSRRIEQAFATSPDPLVPCHNDLLPGNVLFPVRSDDARQGRPWLLDYEYAGMNDAFFDLANLSVNIGLSADADEELVRCYLGRVDRRSMARLGLMKVMSEFREGMWSVVQQAISTLDTDFVAYATGRLDNAERLAGATDVESLLDDAALPLQR
jgi:thiamine kinase-like enzyme